MRRTTLLDRRQMLAGLAVAGVAPGRALAAVPDTRPSVLLVAGPVGGKLDRWANLLEPAIGRARPFASPLVRENVGGLDGVTGANRFELQGEPDGRTALLVPGSAALSWLVGESRAQFSPSRWMPLWAGSASVALVSRVPLTPGRRLEVTAALPTGPELPALLALDLMGLRVELVPSAGNAMLVQGSSLPQALIAAQAAGFEPVMTYGLLGEGGQLRRDPLLPTVPTAVELASRDMGELSSALRAVSLAVQLEASLVLPQLTPAASVAVWRRALMLTLQDGAVISEAARLGVRLVSATDAVACTSRIGDAPGTLLALRQWLATRYGWRPD